MENNLPTDKSTIKAILGFSSVLLFLIGLWNLNAEFEASKGVGYILGAMFVQGWRKTIS